MREGEWDEGNRYWGDHDGKEAPRIKSTANRHRQHGGGESTNVSDRVCVCFIAYQSVHVNCERCVCTRHHTWMSIANEQPTHHMEESGSHYGFAWEMVQSQASTGTQDTQNII